MCTATRCWNCPPSARHKLAEYLDSKNAGTGPPPLDPFFAGLPSDASFLSLMQLVFDLVQAEKELLISPICCLFTGLQSGFFVYGYFAKFDYVLHMFGGAPMAKVFGYGAFLPPKARAKLVAKGLDV